jgi:hypothetical protein
LAPASGHDIAKELVKGIVNRNIAKGSNVETVADALRRREAEELCFRFSWQSRHNLINPLIE